MSLCGGSAPPAPDYTAAAVAQGAADLESVKYQTEANRVNQYTPWGSTTWSGPTGSTGSGTTWNPGTQGTFDQAKYDADMAKYNSELAAYNSGGGGGSAPMISNPNYDPWDLTHAGGPAQIPDPNWSGSGGYVGDSGSPGGTGGVAPVAPNRDSYYSNGTSGSYSPSSGGGQWSQTVALNPEDQAQLDRERLVTKNLTNTGIGMLDRVNAAVKDPLDLSGAPVAGDPSFQVNKDIQEAMMSRMAPDLLRQRQRQEAQLIAQGVGGNTQSEIWDEAQQDLGRNYNDASMQALLAGASEADKQFNRQNTARNQYINEATMMRNMPLNELLALMRGQSVATPQFQGTPNTTAGLAAAPDLLGATQAQYGAQMDAYNAKQASKGNLLSSAMGAGMLAFSDIRLKDNIKRIGELPNGIGVYNYDIDAVNENGVIAQEVLDVLPSAVTLDPDTGYYVVDYAKLDGIEKWRNK
jgi:hypothetical protein